MAKKDLQNRYLKYKYHINSSTFSKILDIIKSHGFTAVYEHRDHISYFRVIKVLCIYDESYGFSYPKDIESKATEITLEELFSYE